MANNKTPDEKQPGEHPDGKFHYNPGDMSGRKPGDAERTEENRGEKPPVPKEKPAG
jgi:hypothetical protein